MTHYEFALAIDGTTLVVTVKWFASQAAANPIHTDVLRYSLTDTAITPDRIQQEVRDRGELIRRGVATWLAIRERFGGVENQRLPFGA